MRSARRRLSSAALSMIDARCFKARCCSRLFNAMRLSCHTTLTIMTGDCGVIIGSWICIFPNRAKFASGSNEGARECVRSTRKKERQSRLHCAVRPCLLCLALHVRVTQRSLRFVPHFPSDSGKTASATGTRSNKERSAILISPCNLYCNLPSVCCTLHAGRSDTKHTFVANR